MLRDDLSVDARVKPGHDGNPTNARRRGAIEGPQSASPATHEIRPTADRLRESVFNILMHAYDNPIEDARVLDLFAGTGALGIEAISRGAKFVLFVDNGAEARALLRNNVELLGSAA